jgi:hypothetical protein
MMFLMKTPPEQVRYQAEAAAAAAVTRLQVPVEVAARKPSYAAAAAAARGVLGQIEADARHLQVGAVEIQPGAIRFALEEKGSALVQVTAVLAVTLTGDAQFWPRAEAVARVLDLVHRYCEPPKPDKDVAVYTGPTRPADPPAA